MNKIKDLELIIDGSKITSSDDDNWNFIHHTTALGEIIVLSSETNSKILDLINILIEKEVEKQN